MKIKLAIGPAALLVAPACISARRVIPTRRSSRSPRISRRRRDKGAAMTLNRREFIKWMSAAAGVGAVAGCATTGGPSAGRVVVIGAGYAGATAAKYVRLGAP